MTEQRWKYPKGTTPPHEQLPTSVTPIVLESGPATSAGRPTGSGKGPNKTEQAIAARIVELGYPAPEQQFRFHPVRRYRFDFAWPAKRLALEFDGGTFGDTATSGHQGHGYANDCRKCNLATAIGWRVYHLSSIMHKEGELTSVLQLMFDGASVL
jgi:hypothetical protein